MIPNERAYLMWRYCKDPNDIDKAIAAHDKNWAGLESLHQIISITYDSNHGSYVVFWRAYCANKLLKLIPPEEMCSRFAVMNAPTVEPERWIPVTEKLPEKRDWYLGIFKEPDTGWINPVPFICDYVGKKTAATTKECWILKDCTDREEHIDYYFDLKCVAWMPIPKLYSDNM